MTTFHLPIDRAAAMPLHRQIYEGLREAILGGALRPGRRIPSSRALAADLALSRQPVLTAYEQLLHEGYLDSRRGSGTFVSTALPDDLLRSGASPQAATGSQNTRHLVDDDTGLGPFRVSLPALDEFPHTVWARLLARHARALTHAQMAYGDAAGLVALRTAIAEH
ncbi:MAG TPA: GntR family transcriptional regulator, partial [Woeseiaceae bacterium]|nr:GntR family transcriptional regulator [Woeseiaceae bacterium]